MRNLFSHLWIQSYATVCSFQHTYNIRGYFSIYLKYHPYYIRYIIHNIQRVQCKRLYNAILRTRRIVRLKMITSQQQDRVSFREMFCVKGEGSAAIIQILKFWTLIVPFARKGALLRRLRTPLVNDLSTGEHLWGKTSREINAPLKVTIPRWIFANFSVVFIYRTRLYCIRTDLFSGLYSMLFRSCTNLGSANNHQSIFAAVPSSIHICRTKARARINEAAQFAFITTHSYILIESRRHCSRVN